MIRPDQLQAAVIARLRADDVLVDALPEGQNGIREAEWHGTAFQYPNVRVERPQLQEQPNGGACLGRVADALVEITVASKRDSSRPASVILGMVEQALSGATITVAAVLRTTGLRPVLMSPVVPLAAGTQGREMEIWQGRLSIGTVVSQLV